MLPFSLTDNIVSNIDNFLKTFFPSEKINASRPFPAAKVDDGNLTPVEKKHVAGLMRVNHSGEIAAQALYQAQGLTARSDGMKKQMQHAAEEEIEHLSWCQQRLEDLGSHTSFLNPLWYTGSFIIGLLAGLAGDRISLGFVAETENQVGIHLQKHLDRLPEQDKKTAAILHQMREDELCHAQQAIHAGGVELPYTIKRLMHLMSKVMTTVSYYV